MRVGGAWCMCACRYNECVALNTECVTMQHTTTHCYTMQSATCYTETYGLKASSLQSPMDAKSPYLLYTLFLFLVLTVSVAATQSLPEIKSESKYDYGCFSGNCDWSCLEDSHSHNYFDWKTATVTITLIERQLQSQLLSSIVMITFKQEDSHGHNHFDCVCGNCD
jgi:hypothetical protein